MRLADWFIYVQYKNNVVYTEESLAHHGIQLRSVAELVFSTKAGAELCVCGGGESGRIQEVKKPGKSTGSLCE